MHFQSFVTQKGLPYFKQWLCILPSPWVLETTHVLSINGNLPTLGISHRWDHPICGLLCLTSLIENNIFFLLNQLSRSFIWETEREYSTHKFILQMLTRNDKVSPTWVAGSQPTDPSLRGSTLTGSGAGNRARTQSQAFLGRIQAS